MLIQLGPKVDKLKEKPKIVGKIRPRNPNEQFSIEQEKLTKMKSILTDMKGDSVDLSHSRVNKYKMLKTVKKVHNDLREQHDLILSSNVTQSQENKYILKQSMSSNKDDNNFVAPDLPHDVNIKLRDRKMQALQGKIDQLHRRSQITEQMMNFKPDPRLYDPQEQLLSKHKSSNSRLTRPSSISLTSTARKAPPLPQIELLNEVQAENDQDKHDLNRQYARMQRETRPLLSFSFPRFVQACEEAEMLADVPDEAAEGEGTA